MKGHPLPPSHAWELRSHILGDADLSLFNRMKYRDGVVLKLKEGSKRCLESWLTGNAHSGEALVSAYDVLDDRPPAKPLY